MESALYVVSTPIGNLGDLTARAADVLREADVVYAEDTRRTGKLLAAVGGVEAALRSLHAHNEAARAGEILQRLRAGGICALVSDAGTPAVSDPGRRVVAAVHEAGLRVIPVPGPSAVLAALAAAGLPADRFLFAGFPPRSGASREEWMTWVAASPATVVAFESPRRLEALLEDLVEAGLGERACCVGRELTKLHEETLRGTVADVLAGLHGRDVRGEVTLVLEGATGGDGWEEEREAVEEAAGAMAAAGHSTRDIAERLQEEFGVPRNDAYRLGLRAAEEGGG